MEQTILFIDIILESTHFSFKIKHPPLQFRGVGRKTPILSIYTSLLDYNRAKYREGFGAPRCRKNTQNTTNIRKIAKGLIWFQI